MLTGLPPFQATSQDEIYRKAKSVDYDWPETDPNPRRCHNDIPSEAKDLVASLLKVDAETRPSPDEIIGHAFFSMHGGNAMPLTLDPSCRRQRPVWLLNEAPLGDVMDRITPRLELRSFARQCGVGHLKDDPEPFEIVGENVDLSLYKECVAEEQAGTSPEVPLPMDMVYTSVVSLRTWPNQRSPGPESSIVSSVKNNADSISRLPQIEDIAPASQVPFGLQPVQPRRAPVQSHAAMLRAAQVGSMPKRNLPKSLPSVTHNQSGGKALDTQTHSRPHHPRRLLNELPVRPNNGASSSGPLRAAAALRQSSRLTRSATMKPSVLQSISDEQAPTSRESEPDTKRRERTAKTEARIAAAVQEEIEEAILSQRNLRRQKRQQPKRTAAEVATNSKLISPDEVPEALVGTKPEDVCHNLRRLRDELSRSLDCPSSQEIDLEIHLGRGKRRANDRPVILKWVDYSHRFGIGYILENGTVGALFNSMNGSPPTCLAVSGADDHLRKRKVFSYADKQQIVLKDGAPIAFFEDCGEEGIRRVLVPAKKYHVNGAQAMYEEFRQGSDNYDREKRERLWLWYKFSRYMTQSLGKDNSDLDAPTSDRETGFRKFEPVGPFIRFYQRLGNVGIWGFGDGSFQINFPDHTKLVLSHDGTWLDFYYLPVQAAQALKRGEILESEILAERGVLRYPTSVMLSGSYRGHEFKRVIAENQLAEKLAFVQEVVSAWSEAGGLGCMRGKKDVWWKGMSEKGGKLVWVTIGAWGDDEKKRERRAS